MTKDTVIVSLTTHSVRVKKVARTTIFSLLNSTYKDIKIVLTLYKDDLKLIPNDLQLMIDLGIVELIVAEQDLGPHLKYFYTMQKYRENPVVTVDDDVIYPADMIKKLAAAYKKYPDSVIARRSYRISQRHGRLDTFRTWLSHFSGVTEPSHFNFPTGLGGILYPPNCLRLSDANVSEILEAKYDDDFYLKALEARQNIKVANICASHSELFAATLDDPITQGIALWNKNKNGGSELSLRKFEQDYMCGLRCG